MVGRSTRNNRQSTDWGPPSAPTTVEEPPAGAAAQPAGPRRSAARGAQGLNHVRRAPAQPLMEQAARNCGMERTEWTGNTCRGGGGEKQLGTQGSCVQQAHAAPRKCHMPRKRHVTRASMAPEEALLTTGVSGDELRSQVTQPEAPRKSAERRMAPKFWPRGHGATGSGGQGVRGSGGSTRGWGGR